MSQPQDLDAILATLAQLSQPGGGQPLRPLYPTPHTNGNDIDVARDSDPYSSPGPSSSTTQPRSLAESSAPNLHPHDPRLRGRPQSRSATPTTSPVSVIDPAKITVWQDGLRCVTKIAAQNKAFELSIKKMMQDQRAHEMRWYSERQALKTTQSSRASSASQAMSILQSLNGNAETESGPDHADVDVEANKANELATFDRKVHAAQQTMEAAMTTELKGLGVPFFGTNEDLVITATDQEVQHQLSASRPKWSTPVTDHELLLLRRKMVGHLEDLYRD
ncbi:hypothetical protein B0A48_03981 [Cryoendolithus antarcticus]|uniref:Uncharacterized protein n=1 Tax=Cryoendolithus antarcticus TaxID=1507870 RepID=A0A1V8THF9_9PEZI|nr:hypothetical protein B0A48_03981 [Cryoendolithus antarcticus]